MAGQRSYGEGPFHCWSLQLAWPCRVSACPREAPTTTISPSAALATIQPVFTDAERVALAGFLAEYRGLTCEACALAVPRGALLYSGSAGKDSEDIPRSDGLPGSEG